MRQRLLITGSTGYLARHVVAALRAAGERLEVIGTSWRGQPAELAGRKAKARKPRCVRS